MSAKPFPHGVDLQSCQSANQDETVGSGLGAWAVDLGNAKTATERKRKSGIGEGSPVFGRMTFSPFRGLQTVCAFAPGWELRFRENPGSFVTQARQPLYRRVEDNV